VFQSNDGGDNQVQAAGAISLVLETAVAEVALAVEENGTRESVSVFPFVEAYLDTPADLGVFHPLQHKKRALDAADFAKRSVESVLAGITGELADNERRGYGSVPRTRA
jgi:hypothetical protein